jgi:hypothetical protein
MRERDLVRLRARTILRCYTDEDPRRLRGTKRAGYRMLLRGLRGLAEWARKYGAD